MPIAGRDTGVHEIVGVLLPERAETQVAWIRRIVLIPALRRRLRPQERPKRQMQDSPDPKPEPAYRRRKAQRPDEILAAGLEEFYEHGFSGARMDRIARRAGVSRATLYFYFEKKESLFDAVAEHAMGRFIDGAAQELSTFDGSIRDIIEAMVRRFYAQVVTTKNSAILRILLSEGGRSPELVERYHTMVIARGKATLQAIIDRGIAQGELRDAAATSFPQMIPAPAMFYLVSQLVFGEFEKIDADEFIEAHLDVLFNGILVSKT